MKSLSAEDRKIIGIDIKTVQLRWPLGMPLIRKLDSNLWEIRSKLNNRIARVIFTIGDSNIIILHGFIKKSQTTPLSDLELAKVRLRQLHN